MVSLGREPRWQEYATAANGLLGAKESFLEVFSGPNAPPSDEVGAAIGAHVPGCKLERRGKGDRVELQNLSQLLNGSHPIVSSQASSASTRARPSVSAPESFYREATISAGRQAGHGKRWQLIEDSLQDPSKHMGALMEILGNRYGIEDTSVPKLCLTGMPIVGRALESPFFHHYQVPAAIMVTELLSSALIE